MRQYSFGKKSFMFQTVTSLHHFLFLQYSSSMTSGTRKSTLHRHLQLRLEGSWMNDMIKEWVNLSARKRVILLFLMSPLGSPDWHAFYPPPPPTQSPAFYVVICESTIPPPPSVYLSVWWGLWLVPMYLGDIKMRCAYCANMDEKNLGGMQGMYLLRARCIGVTSWRLF